MTPFQLFFLAAALLAGTALAETDLEQRVTDIIEAFRSDMKNGRPDIGVPVLEPFVIKELPIDVKLYPFDARCVALDTSVAGVSEFQFTRISQIPGTNSLSMSVQVPEVNVEGTYDVTGRVRVGFINVKLGGQGPLEVILHGVRGAATVDVLVNDDGSLNIENVEIGSWSFDKLTIKLDNLLGGGAIGNTVNLLINKLAPTFVNVNRGMINGLLETFGKQLVNKYLDGIAGKGKVSHFARQPLPAIEDTILTISEDDWIVPEEAKEILQQLAVAAIAHSRISN